VRYLTLQHDLVRACVCRVIHATVPLIELYIRARKRAGARGRISVSVSTTSYPEDRSLFAYLSRGRSSPLFIYVDDSLSLHRESFLRYETSLRNATSEHGQQTLIPLSLDDRSLEIYSN